MWCCMCAGIGATDPEVNDPEVDGAEARGGRLPAPVEGREGLAVPGANREAASTDKPGTTRIVLPGSRCEYDSGMLLRP